MVFIFFCEGDIDFVNFFFLNKFKTFLNYLKVEKALCYFKNFKKYHVHIHNKFVF